MKHKAIFILFFIGICQNLFACSGGKEEGLTPDPPPEPKPTPGYVLPTGKQIYIPNEWRNNDFTKKDSKWSYYRMAYSDNFVVFWENGFGEAPSLTTDPTMRVDINDLLEKAELFYDVNVNKLGFVQTGKSKTDKYRMMIFLLYQSEWLATGSGYDDTIGALWVNPSTCQPVGATIAHEVGHSFQYQTFCDNPASGSGWRYGFGENSEGGNGFWEQCAQWQAHQVYPEERFTSYNFSEYMSSTFKHPLHETPRYANYFIQDYWCMKHGQGFIGKLWRESCKPEDPIEAYKRITSITQEEFNNEMFDAARRLVNWDIAEIKELGKNYKTRSQTKLISLDNGYYRIESAECIENYGYNVISLNVPAAGTIISADFAGIAGADEYRKKEIDKAGWRYGFVACLKDGSCIYSDMFSAKEGKATFICPANCQKLDFVVSGAPATHWHHAWDDNDANDEQWPYQVKFQGTSISGYIDIDPDKSLENVSLTYDVTIPLNNTDYTYTKIEIETYKLCQALTLTTQQIRDMWGKDVIFAGVNRDGTLHTASTANDPGHWYDADGNVCNWGNSAHVFSEFNKDKFVFQLGQYPGHCSTGEKHTIKQAFIYEYQNGQKVQATVIFNIVIQ